MKILKLLTRGEPWLLSVFFVIAFCIVTASITQAQYKYDYEWLFGYNGEDWDHPRFAINKISFHSNPPDTIRTPLYGSTGASAAVSIADSRGEILFYSNGCRLFNADGSIVPGGEVLLEGPSFDRHCSAGHPLHIENYATFLQGRFILPLDHKDSIFFFLYQRRELTHETNIDEPFGIVAFDLNLGKIEKVGDEYEMVSRQVIHDQMFASGGMTAIRAKQMNHWWIVVPPHVHLNNYESILLGNEGVDTTVSFYADFSEFPFAGRWIFPGQAVFCPIGETYVQWIPADTVGTLIFDFDRSTGELSNMRHLPHPERDNYEPFFSSGGAGAAISPNGRFLYINTLTNLYQYDLEAEDIEGSKVHIGEFDGFQDPGNDFPTYFFMQQLAPDCRIYMSAQNTVRFLHVINHPNRKGKACDFQQHSFKLPGNHRFGLPYHPNYRLGTDYPVCDSTLTSTVRVLPEAEGGIHLYPNPARAYAVVEWSGMSPVEIELYDMSGREVYSSRMQPGLPEYYLDLGGFSAGVYVVRLRDREGGVVTERLVVME